MNVGSRGLKGPKNHRGLGSSRIVPEVFSRFNGYTLSVSLITDLSKVGALFFFCIFIFFLFFKLKQKKKTLYFFVCHVFLLSLL